MKYHAALREALRCELERDPSVFMMGEDVGMPGGIFAQTRGLYEEFGEERMRDTPAAELAVMGAAVGAALTGSRPIVEISFADFFMTCIDQLVNQAAKIRYMSGGQAKVPLTVISFGGAGRNAGPQHSGSYEAWLGSIPGLRVVMPATPHDVQGLVKAAIRDDDPTIVILNKALLGIADDSEPGVEPIPFGQAEIRREGEDVTIVAWSAMVHTALEAAERLAAEDGISCEVIDLRSIQPLDGETVGASARKTGRVVTVQETITFAGIGAEVAAEVSRRAFGYLDAPVQIVGPPFTPVPFSKPMEEYVLPSVGSIIGAVKEIL
jgi:pyruvate dehydrogenase E1 component beta subunit